MFFHFTVTQENIYFLSDIFLLYAENSQNLMKNVTSTFFLRFFVGYQFSHYQTTLVPK